MINKVIVSGKLADNPEVEYTSNGFPLCKLNVINLSPKKVDGEWEDVETYIPGIVVWGAKAEELAENCKEGDKVLVDGKVTVREWEKAEGDIRYFLEVTAQNVEYFGSGETMNLDPNAHTDKEPTPEDENIPF